MFPHESIDSYGSKCTIDYTVKIDSKPKTKKKIMNTLSAIMYKYKCMHVFSIIILSDISTQNVYSK